MNSFRTAMLLLAGFGLPVVTLSPSVEASGGLRTVAFSGDAVPGLNAGVEFNVLGIPTLNGNGHTAITANFTGLDVDGANNSGIFSEGRGNGLMLLARAGESTPGSDGTVVYGEFNPLSYYWGNPLLNDSGQTAFTASLAGDSVQGSCNRGLFWGNSDGNISSVVREGDIVSGMNHPILFFYKPVLNEGGRVAFGGYFLDDGDLRGGAILTSNGRDLSVVAREGDPAPGFGPNVRFGGFGGIDTYPAIDDLGRVIFQSGVSGPISVIDYESDGGIFRSDGTDEVEVMIRTGAAGPGTHPDLDLTSIYNASPNNSGQIAFGSQIRLRSGGNKIGYESGVFLINPGGTITQIARSGAPAPVFGSEANFAKNSFFPLVLNGSGRVAFAGKLDATTIDDSNDTVLFRQGKNLQLQEVAREGSAAPGTPPGVQFGNRDIKNYYTFEQLVFNELGQAAFLSPLRGKGVNDANDYALFAQDLTGNLQLIARTGDLLDVSDDPQLPDFRVISELRFAGGTGNEDGRRGGFNDRGQLAFLARFTDGTSGVFVSDMVAVPEPAALALLGMLVCVCAGRRWR